MASVGMGATLAVTRVAAGVAGGALAAGGLGGVAYAADMDQPDALGLSWGGPGPLDTGIPAELYWSTSFNDETGKSAKKKGVKGPAGGGQGNANEPTATGRNDTATHSGTTSGPRAGGGQGNAHEPTATGRNDTATHSGTTSGPRAGGGQGNAHEPTATGRNDTATHTNTTSAPRAGGGQGNAHEPSPTGGNGTPTHTGTTSANRNGNNGNVGGGQGNAHDKVWVCHGTGSQSNPFVLIHIDRNGWDNGHSDHEGDRLASGSNDTCATGQVGGQTGGNNTDGTGGNNNVDQTDTGTMTGTNPGTATGTATQTNTTVHVQQATGGGQGQVPNLEVGGQSGQQANNGVIQSRVITPERLAEMFPQSGLAPEDFAAMDHEEVRAMFESAGMEMPAEVGGLFGSAAAASPEETGGAGGFAQEVGGISGGGLLPSALPSAGDVLPIAAQAVVGLGTLLAGAGALMRRMRG